MVQARLTMSSRDFLSRIASNWPVKILAVVAAIILHLSYRIGNLEERFFSVPLVIEVSESFVPVGNIPRSVRITVRGTADEVFLLLENDIEAYVDLTDHAREGQFRVPVLVRKRGTAANTELELEVDPLEVTVTQEQRVVRSVDIAPSISGFPAEGFELAEYSIEPTSIEIEGPRSAVEPVENATTDEIDLTGRAEDFTIRLRSYIDAERASIVGSDVVEFTGSIEPVIIARFFDAITIAPVRIPDGITVALGMGSGSVRVRGAFSVMDGLTARDLRLRVDCSSMEGPGSFELPIEIITPDGVEVISVQPNRVEVTAIAITDSPESEEPIE